MNILILNYEFPPLGGGAGNATKNIAKELVGFGHSVTVVSTQFDTLPEIEDIDGYRVIRVNSRRKRADRSNTFEMLHYVFCVILRSRSLVKTYKPNHILSFFALPTGLIAWYMKKVYGLHYTLSLRGGDVPGFLPKNLHTLHVITAPLTYFVWKNASKIVANSQGLQILASKTGKKVNKEILYIPNGVDTNVFKPDNHQQDTCLSLLFVGRLTEQKGVTHILHALHSIRTTQSEGVYKNIKCTVVGDGPLREVLKKESITLGIQELVDFKGWIDRKELPKLYAAHDVFILPSAEEGMPNVVLEALASGLSIIATKVAGNEELVVNQKNGFLITDTKDISSCILKLFHDRITLRNYKEYSRKIAEERGWHSVAESYHTILTKNE